ncbi:hypothetical protein COY05_02160 [Candidatus Peregrinibacteria bacterium CG_4_10_14_0_2_um_filter_38_24]|nr:MAG: hypothetical protein COY05_02160 [Candidatus Peregrinibacteria bacterium CG_4_10_14_0_2_um_filter_38_24]PJC38606.1 MAG: hypothetical protein CO044_04105 [Candidatus Peregrinibacteria bacterium CG_4_9_14_0_2_um_filter_38_9]
MIRKFLAGTVLSIFVVLATLFYTIIALYLTVFNKDFYTSDKFVAYSYDLAIAELPNYLEGNLPENFSSEYVSDVIKKYFTSAEFKPVVSDLGDQVGEAIKVGGNREFNIDLSVFTKKRNLISEEFASHLAENLNICIDSSVYVPENPRCIPSGVSKGDFVRQFKATFDRKLFSQIPSQFTFSVNLPTINGSVIFDLAYTIFYAYVALLVVLLIIGGLLVFRPFIRILKWIILGFLNSLVLFTASIFVPTLLPIKTIPGIFDLLFGHIFIYLFVLICILLGLFILTIVFDKEPVYDVN